MHELSIAQSLIDVACEAAAREGANRVLRLLIRVGALSGVEQDALRFSFDLAAEETPCAGAALEIETVEVTVMCLTCNAARTLKSICRFCCPTCGTPTVEVLTGRELELAFVEVEMPAEHSSLPAEVAER